MPCLASKANGGITKATPPNECLCEYGNDRAAVDNRYVVEAVRWSDRGATKPRAGCPVAGQRRNSLVMLGMTGIPVLCERSAAHL
jgi:hypothetical protein